MRERQRVEDGNWHIEWQRDRAVRVGSGQARFNLIDVDAVDSRGQLINN